MANNVIEIILESNDQASKTIEGFGKALGGLAIGAFVKEVAEAAFELGSLALQADAAEARFVAFAGSASKANAIMEAIQSTTGGTVDKMTAMSSATQLLSMGLVTTADETANVVNMAMRLGDQTQGASDRIENFALLLANQSIPRLDSFGISAATVRNRIAELQEANQGMSRETAFMTAVMEQGAVSMEKLGDAGLDATQNADRATSAFADLKVELGRAFAPAVSESQGAAAKLATSLTDNIRASNELKEAHGELGPVITGSSELFRVYHERLVAIQRANETSTERMSALAGHYEDIAAQHQELPGLVGNSANAFDQYNQALARSEEAAGRATQAQQDLKWSMQETSDQAAASLSEMSDASFAQAQIQALKDAGVEGEAFVQGQREILMHFGLLTEEEIAQQEALEGVIAGYADGSVELSTLGNRLDTVRNVAEEDVAAFDELNTSIPLTTEKVRDLSGAGSDAAGHLQDMGVNIDGVGDSAGNAMGPVEDLGATIEGLESKTIVLTVEQRINSVSGAMEAAAGSGMSQEDLAGIIGGGLGFASGGAFTVPPGYSNDTFPMRVSSGEQVIVIPRDTTNNYNLSVNSGQAASNVEQDFNFMRAFAR